MAKLRVFQTIKNEVYQLRFENDPSALANQDKELMEKYGEPEINIGGSFGTTPDDFLLPDEYVKIRSGFPVYKEFDSKAAPFDTNTATKVNSYRDSIVNRFSTALTDLRANVDGYTSELIYNV